MLLLGGYIAEQIDLRLFHIQQTLLQNPCQRRIPEGNELVFALLLYGQIADDCIESKE